MKAKSVKAVKKTTTKAKLKIILRHLHNSFQEIAHDASYKSGGRNNTNISSGSILILGIEGIKVKNKPATTKRIG